MIKPFVLLSQGKVENDQGVMVLDADVLFDRPESTRPQKVQALKEQLEEISAQGPTFPVGQWITICDDWLAEHRAANEDPEPDSEE